MPERAAGTAIMYEIPSGVTAPVTGRRKEVRWRTETRPLCPAVRKPTRQGLESRGFRPRPPGAAMQIAIPFWVVIGLLAAEAVKLTIRAPARFGSE